MIRVQDTPTRPKEKEHCFLDSTKSSFQFKHVSHGHSQRLFPKTATPSPRLYPDCVFLGCPGPAVVPLFRLLQALQVSLAHRPSGLLAAFCFPGRAIHLRRCFVVWSRCAVWFVRGFCGLCSLACQCSGVICHLPSAKARGSNPKPIRGLQVARFHE